MNIEATHGSLTPEIVKEVLRIRNAQIKRFLVKAREAGTVDDITIVLARVTSKDISSFVTKLQNLAGVTHVRVAAQERGAGTDAA